jgi:hypothetical protein
MGVKVLAASAVGLLALLTACNDGNGTAVSANTPASTPDQTTTSEAPAAGGSSGGGTCPVGDYQVETIAGKTGADVSGVPVTATSGGGFSLSLTGQGTWKLDGANATVTLSAAGLSVDATVNGTAEGTYAKTGANYTFHQERATGKVTLKQKVGGTNSWSMDQVGPALAPGGQATLTCGDGTLELSSESVLMSLKSTGASGGGGGVSTSTSTASGGSGGSTGGGTLVISTSAQTKTIDCAGRVVSINASSNRLTFTGNCASLSINGSKNEISLESVGVISVNGSFNHVTWSSGNPKTSNNGQSNTITHG